VGKEVIGKVPTWHVRYDARARCHFWIEDSEPFRVHKVQYEARGKSTGLLTTISSAFGDDGSPFPLRVDVKRTTRDRVDMESTLAVQTMRLNVPVNPNVGSLASLEIPAGVDVVDTIGQKYLGVWNGEKIAPSDKYRQSGSAVYRLSWHQLQAGIGIVALFVGAVGYLWVRHRRSMRQLPAPKV
jgi:hypothetical protein